MSMNYVPIVKSKANDIKAIGRVDADLRQSIKPVLEVLPYLKKGPVDEHLLKVVTYVTKYLGAGPLFVDIYGLSPTQIVADGTSGVIAGFEWIAQTGRTFTPVYGFHRDDQIWPSIKSVVKKNGQGFCFRVEIDDLDDVAEDTWAEIIERSAQLGLSASMVDILIDLKDIRTIATSQLKELVVDFLSINSSASKYRSIILAGSSALSDVSGVEKDATAPIMRNELFLWSLLRRDIDEKINLVFGDYGVVHPRFNGVGGAFLNMNAKIRYTAGANIHYFRGHGLLRPKKDFVQYRELAQRVMQHKKFQGRQCSFGDGYVEDCVACHTTPGSPATWILADMNHHITYTARQMTVLKTTVLTPATDQQVMALIDAT